MLNQGSDTTPCERVTMKPTAVTRKIEPSSLERAGRNRSLERVFVPALRWLKFSEHRCKFDNLGSLPFNYNHCSSVEPCSWLTAAGIISIAVRQYLFNDLSEKFVCH